MSLQNLANAYAWTGDFGNAIPLFEGVHAARQRTLGPEHPETLAALNMLAYVYESAGNLGKAIALYKRALAVSEQVLGADHDLTRTIQTNVSRATP